ncbi:ABC transporter permease [Thalassotalea euphylliae]|uniref:Cell division protein FtsX n=1 Tax=Thalassotalea euphylliae TaxID=1655234 RepID=A0A3E0UHM4_9GAMM|nr:FtsX-like permease family protein [Thalassotalea euphylliae]REL35262.1 cell division protein FtsX [Thalassotalea euphylliae]
MLTLGPIFRALLRNKVGALLIAIQIAFTMAIIVNSVFIIIERSQETKRPSGIDEANSFFVNSSGFSENFSAKATIEEDLANIRALPGVIDAIQINAIPVSGSGWSMGLQTEPGAEHDGVGTAVYMVDERGINALDVQLLAGENFSASDIRWRGNSASDWPDKIIVTEAMAKRLFPDLDYAQTIGKTVYINDTEPMIITGVIDKLQAPWVGWNNVDNSFLSPEYLERDSSTYFIRTEDGQRDEMMKQVEELLSANKSRVVQNMRSVDYVRERSYRGHNAMIKILSTVIITLTIVTSLGIVGLASFSVNRRKKQIGIRRALGATKADILRYFMTENLIISAFGVLLGAALTIGLNMVLVNALSLTPMSWFYIPVGMLVLCLVGQAAVFGPARKATSIAPATATRTV